MRREKRCQQDREFAIDPDWSLVIFHLSFVCCHGLSRLSRACYNPGVVTVEILTIGNEILLGRIQDTNSNYLCRVVRGMGGLVRHISIVPDQIEAIADELKNSIERRTQLILTCGGLGPTDDDLTLAAVALVTSRKLELDDTALEFVTRRYAELASQGFVSSPEMTEARLKMARLPEGGHPIENPAGASPAAVIEFMGTHIVSLPGVPAELKAIVHGPLHNLLTQLLGKSTYRELEMTVACNDESELAPVLRLVGQMHPEIYIKSRARRFGKNERFSIEISASAATAEETERIISRAVLDLTKALADAGIQEK